MFVIVMSWILINSVKKHLLYEILQRVKTSIFSFRSPRWPTVTSGVPEGPGGDEDSLSIYVGTDTVVTVYPVALGWHVVVDT